MTSLRSPPATGPADIQPASAYIDRCMLIEIEAGVLGAMKKAQRVFPSRAVAALAIVLLVPTARASAAVRTCPSSTTLDALVTCIRNQMPGRDSNGFQPPGATEQTGWRAVVRQMLQGACGFPLPGSVDGIMNIRTFTDSENGKSYCLFMEVLDANGNGKVDRGWGTFIVDPLATRELSHHAPHPISDSTTENEAVGVFKATGSKSYLMAGAHREANPAASSCQGSYKQADVSHNVANMFQPANDELRSHYASSSWNVIQWHGMAADTCSNVDVYLTHGLNRAPVAPDTILELRDNMRAHHPGWAIEVPGAGACGLNATDNVQGRLLNGVPAGSVCSTAAEDASGTFIHIEQDPGFRAAVDWAAAIQETWPLLPPGTPGRVPDGWQVPGAPLRITRDFADPAQLALSWGVSCGGAAVDYAVYEGRAGEWNSHLPALCTTGDATSATLTPGTEGRYYLVVPHTGGVEGSYGMDSSAAERPRSASPCVPASDPTGCPANDRMHLPMQIV